MAATDVSMRFFMLLLASKMKPTETGPSSLERLTTLCSTSSSNTRKTLGRQVLDWLVHRIRDRDRHENHFDIEPYVGIG